ncbi:tetratricopeptide repeat-containing sensor histidine kinase [Dyadobacter luticola]|uniref:Oxygen sensor histidine kinase NreB n=1 Tax=Dyadobacter luticola TaxID=1979387 RepID=A0A5R9L3D0_9BACT|nr:sensor histidine kinase [Dyadobacter luticola]TLV02770.1 tetratricopeptide repeat protein [Dyadobacter luticola]
MIDFCKLLFPVIFIALLSGGCSSSNSDVFQSDKDEIPEAVPRENFEEDTALVIKYYKKGASYIFIDADKSMFYAKHILFLSQKHQWSKGKILAYNLLSTYYLLDGSYDILRELSNETMILSKRMNMPLYTAHAKRFLAESFSEYRQWDSARVNYEQAIEIFTQLDADSARALTVENLANAYREKSMYDVAIKYYDQAYTLFDSLDSDWGRASILQNKGYMKVRIHEYAEAEKYFQQSLELSRKTNSRYGELNTLNDLSNVYFRMGQFDKAIEEGKKALAQAKLYHSNQQTNWALITLSRAYASKGMYKEALEYNIQVNYSWRMVHNDDVKRQYTMYQLTYENELMDSAMQQKIISEQKNIQRVLIVFTCLIIAFAAFLWFNNKKLRRKNTEIREALIQGQTIERKRVAAELHDHLGGTLASLNWYLYGIDKKVLSPEEQKIYNSVHQMVGSAYRELRSLSHNLMPAELEEHGLIVALNRLVDKLNENKNIDFKFNLTGLKNRMNNKIEFELYSIILELANNIIKHSAASQASIDLVENTKTITLVVADNGSGMIDPSRQGIGLKNVKNRVESLHGKIQIQSQESKGTRVEIEIPKTVAR